MLFCFGYTSLDPRRPSAVEPLHAGANNRRSVLVALPGFVIASSSPAFAKYGDSSNLELPSYIDFLIEKNKTLDPDAALYKGADPTVLLRRLADANQKLADIPNLAEQKKWSQVQGVLTGPLGTLGQTLQQLASSSPELQTINKSIKSNLIAIGQAASKKDGVACAKLAQKTSVELEAFVKLAFQ